MRWPLAVIANVHPIVTSSHQVGQQLERVAVHRCAAGWYVQPGGYIGLVMDPS